MIERRGFLTALMGAGLGIGSGRRQGGGRRRRLSRIGLELYTVRDDMRRDFEETLTRVRTIGYDEVEFGPFPPPGVDPARLRPVLDRLELQAPSGHVTLEQMADDWDGTLALARRVGLEYVILAWIPPESRQGLEDYRTIARRLNDAGRAAKSAGLQMGYHNHDFELAPLEGVVPYDLLLAETDPDLVVMQMDLFWMTKGGGDPLAYFGRYPGRFHSVHVKDMASSGDMADVGSGTIDFASVFARADQAGIRHYFVEHDEPASPMESVRRSYQYLSGLEF